MRYALNYNRNCKTFADNMTASITELLGNAKYKRASTISENKTYRAAN